MSSLKFNLSEVTSFLRDFLQCIVWASKIYIQDWGNHMSMRKWTDADGVHHWRIFRSSYSKLVWVGFEPRTTEFRLHAKADY